MVKGVDKEQQTELSDQIKKLSEKIDAIDSKLTKVEECSNATVTHIQSIANMSDIQKANLVMSNNVSDPNGFIAREITNQLIVMLQKYQTTDFRRWLVLRGRNVVEQAVAGFVSQQLPQLKWYNVQLSKIDEKTYHQTAKTTFPVQIKTGIPLISAITVAKVNFEYEGDVDIKTNTISNTKSRLNTSEEEKQVFKSFIEDLDSSLKPHKKTYSILHPIGAGINRLYALFMKETNFSIPFITILLLTMLIPSIWPASFIYFGLLRAYPIWFWFLGISIQNLVLGIINGAIYGAFFWLAIRYKFLERLKILGFLTKINKPGGKQIDLRVAAGAGIACIVLITGIWWVTLPKAGGVDVAAVRIYSDPDSTAMLQALNTGNYYTITNILDGSSKTVLTEPGFAGYSLYVKRNLGNYNSTVFWQASSSGSVVKATYNATYSGVQGKFPIVFSFINNGGAQYLSSVEFQAPTWNFKVP
ncbi:MAG: hypothetical protein NTV61_10610 [Candidatus Bathyarchaeota archaeon]|nr:hypothetical protein [Candidatus Bathyarchaeota archaeon]